MLAVNRLKKIEELLYEHGSVISSDLSELFEVSEETIRRDLEKLEKENKLKRVRGGAYLNDDIDKEVPIKIRENIFLEEKQLIGEKCVELIKSGDIIMLDSSTTALYVAKNLNMSALKATVITNSLKIAYELENSNDIKVICLGGTLRKKSSSFVGYMTTESLEKLSANKAFISCSSLNVDFGVTDNSESEAMVRKLMIKKSVKTILIVDYTKFDEPSVSKICDLEDINTIVTDEKIPKEYIDILARNEVEIIYSKYKTNKNK